MGLRLEKAGRDDLARMFLPEVPPVNDELGGGRTLTAIRDERFVLLVALPESVSEARAHIRVRLAMWDRPDLVDAAELVVSELASNAVKATEAAQGGSRSGVIGLSVYPMHGRVVVEVWDCSLAPPRLVEADADAVSGRGLFLVDALSAGVWDYRWPATGGKVVYASIKAAL